MTAKRITKKDLDIKEFLPGEGADPFVLSRPICKKCKSDNCDNCDNCGVNLGSSQYQGSATGMEKEFKRRLRMY